MNYTKIKMDDDKFLYIQSNPEWIYKYKYGYTTNPKNRPIIYKKLFKYKLTEDYILSYNQIDCW